MDQVSFDRLCQYGAVTAQIFGRVFALLILIYVTWLIYAVTLHPLAKYPGPMMAKWTRFWHAYNVYNGHFEDVQLSLHRRHGHIVRVAPNELSISDPEAIKIIYNAKGTFVKTDFYDVFFKGGVFPEKDEKVHASLRKVSNPIYTMSNVLESEPYIDRCSEMFAQRMGEFADAHERLDIGEWVHM